MLEIERELRKEVERWKEKMIAKIQHDTVAIMEMLNTRIDKWRDDKVDWNKLGRDDKIELIRLELKKGVTKAEAMRRLGISKKTLYKYLKRV